MPATPSASWVGVLLADVNGVTQNTRSAVRVLFPLYVVGALMTINGFWGNSSAISHGACASVITDSPPLTALLAVGVAFGALVTSFAAHEATRPSKDEPEESAQNGAGAPRNQQNGRNGSNGATGDVIESDDIPLIAHARREAAAVSACVFAESFLTYLCIAFGITHQTCWSWQYHARVVYPLRYVYWTASVPLIMGLIGRMGRASKNELDQATISTAAIMITGLAADMAPAMSPAFFVCALLSFAAYAYATTLVVDFMHKAKQRCSESTTQGRVHILSKVFMLLWAGFPLEWTLSVLGILSARTEQAVWPILDAFAKVTLIAFLLIVSGNMERSSAEFETALRIGLLEAERSAAEASNEAKRTFMRFVLHEARNPLNTIMLGLEWLLLANESLDNAPSTASGTDGPQHHVAVANRPSASTASAAAAASDKADTLETLDLVYTSAQAIQKLLDGFLSLEKIESGRFQLELSAYTIKDLVQPALRSIAMLAHRKSIQVVSIIDDDVPVTAFGDVHRFRQVVVNFLSNAVKFSPVGSAVVVHVSVYDQSVVKLGRPSDTVFSGSGSGRRTQQRKVASAGHEGSLLDSSSSHKMIVARSIPPEASSTSDVTSPSSRTGASAQLVPAARHLIHAALASAESALQPLSGGSSAASQRTQRQRAPARNISVLEIIPDNRSPMEPPTAALKPVGVGAGRIPSDGSGAGAAVGHADLHAADDASDPAAKRTWIRIAVQDAGIGISEEDQRRLFQPFVQITAGALQKGNGTGLGLAICKRIIDACGGCIGVDSEVGEGAKFWFAVPRWVRREVQPGDTAAEADASDPTLSEQYHPTPSRSEASRSDGDGFPVLPAEVGGLRRRAVGVKPLSKSDSIPRVALSYSVPSGGSALGWGTGEPAGAVTAGGSSTSAWAAHAGNAVDPLRAPVVPGSRLTSNELAPPANSGLDNALDLPAGAGAMSVVLPAGSPESAGASGAGKLPRDAPRAHRTVAASSAPPHMPLGDVVVIDDVPSNRMLLSRLLSTRGARSVKSFGSGLETLAFAATLDADALATMTWFSDKEMPGMDGHELVSRLRELGVTGPILGVTGNALAEDQAAFISAGADVVVTKPIEWAALERALATCGRYITGPSN